MMYRLSNPTTGNQSTVAFKEAEPKKKLASNTEGGRMGSWYDSGILWILP